MELLVNLEDYLTNEEIKECCKDAVKNSIAKQYARESEVHRLVSNLSRQFVWDIVDSFYPENLEEFVKTKVVEAIEDLSQYSIFRKKDIWENKDSPAYLILEEVCKNSRPLIEKRVEEIIKEYPFHELDRDEIGDTVYQCVMDKLFGDKKNV